MGRPKKEIIIKDKPLEIRPTLCLDFDGVIHSFKSDWIDDDVIVDPPEEGVVEAIDWFKDHGFVILVHSCRSKTESGIRAMEEYMDEHGIRYDKVCKDKPTAHFYIDDHGFKFNNWESALNYFNDYYTRRLDEEAKIKANKENRRENQTSSQVRDLRFAQKSTYDK